MVSVPFVVPFVVLLLVGRAITELMVVVTVLLLVPFLLGTRVVVTISVVEDETGLEEEAEEGGAENAGAVGMKGLPGL